jgi:hypothetical protein
MYQLADEVELDVNFGDHCGARNEMAGVLFDNAGRYGLGAGSDKNCNRSIYAFRDNPLVEWQGNIKFQNFRKYLEKQFLD